MNHNAIMGMTKFQFFLIRAVLHIIIDPLVYLVDLSFVTGIFPERLKLGKLVPIHKTGNVKSVENYRPIIMPSVFSKTMESPRLNLRSINNPIFINDMPLHVSSNNTILCADDTTVLDLADTLADLQQKLNMVAAEFSQCCARNSLVINLDKIVMMCFGNRCRHSMQITVDCIIIDESPEAEFLGTTIDRATILLQAKKYLNLNQTINVYYAIIHSHLSYSVVLWGTSPTVDRVFVAQKRALSLTFGLT
nr:unnamed protein product [Callosobruchus chinensis]